MGMYDREFRDNVTKSDIIVGFFMIIFIIGVILGFIATLDKKMDNVSSRFDTAIEEYTAKGYVVCDVKVKNGRYNNVVVKEDEIASYKEKKSFMMSLHSLLTDDIYIVSMDNITEISMHAEKKQR